MLLPLVLCFLYPPLSFATAKVKRGDAPRCQEECLARHSEAMGRLSQEYMKTRSIIEYQDRVEEEITNYSRCLTDCREVLPIK